MVLLPEALQHAVEHQDEFERPATAFLSFVALPRLTNAPRLYEKAGMQTVQTYHIYSKTIS